MAAKHPAAGTAGATSPAGVTCAAGDPVVWVNTETKVYHLAGSTYYGKTKHGKYACASDAAKMGAHAAKRESGSAVKPGGLDTGFALDHSALDGGASPAPGTATGSGGKHHRRKGGHMASPVPVPSPTF
jgi:hypothetical protein